MTRDGVVLLKSPLGQQLLQKNAQRFIGGGFREVECHRLGVGVSRTDIGFHPRSVFVLVDFLGLDMERWISSSSSMRKVHARCSPCW